MASTYPGTVDTFATTSPTNLGDDDSTGRNHAERHDDMGAAMMAVQTELAATYSPYHCDMVANGYSSSGIYFSSTALTESREHGAMFVPRQSCTVDRIAVYVVTSAGSTGALIRLGIRAWDAANGRPGAVILDAGTLDATSLGFKEITISQAVTAGVPLFLSATAQGGPTTPATVSIIQGRSSPGAPSSVTVGAAHSWYADSVTGALGTPTWVYGTSGAPRVWLRTAA